MAPYVIYPVEELQKNLEALAAARLLCLEAPEPKAVHRLRTLTRRVEAQLALLDGVAGLPKHARQAKRLRKELKELRQGAGDVRDLDVQLKRVASLAGAKSGAEGGAIPQNRTGAAASEMDLLQEGAGVLGAHLEKRRNRSAEALEAHLRKHEARLAVAAQELLECLGEANRLALAPEELLACATALMAKGALLQKNLRKSLTEDELHSVRKAAKAARYLAEMLPRAGAAGSAAGRFEALQDVGGAWHDNLQLARTAKDLLGRKHTLTAWITSERKREQRLYREALRAEAKLVEHTAQTGSHPAG